MSNYYKDQQEAFKALNAVLDTQFQNKQDVILTNLIYNLTLKFPVSTKVLEKQIDRYIKINGLKLKGDIIIMKDKNEE